MHSCRFNRATAWNNPSHCVAPRMPPPENANPTFGGSTAAAARATVWNPRGGQTKLRTPGSVVDAKCLSAATKCFHAATMCVGCIGPRCSHRASLATSLATASNTVRTGQSFSTTPCAAQSIAPIAAIANPRCAGSGGAVMLGHYAKLRSLRMLTIHPATNEDWPAIRALLQPKFAAADN